MARLIARTDYVLSQNLHRRHLTASQKAMVAAAALPLYEAEAKERMQAGGKTEVRQGKEIIPTPAKGQARDKAAEAVGVNPRYVSDAKKLIEDAPEVAEQVKAGEITLPPVLERPAHCGGVRGG